MIHLQFDPRTAFPDLVPTEMVSRQAVELFERARQKSLRKRVGSWVVRTSRQLLSLDVVREQVRIRNQHAAGIQIVDLEHIRGSAGRMKDFDAEFYPRNGRTEQRWVAVASAFLRGDSLPPVELIQVGDVFYVIDGHHRVSVSRMLDRSHVDAEVTVWELVEDCAS